MLGTFLFPSACVGCSKEGEGYLCQSCTKDLFRLNVSLLNESELVSLGAYDDLLKKCILLSKDRGHKALAQELCTRASDYLSAERPEFLKVTHLQPAPSSKEGLRLRGYSLPELFCASLQKENSIASLDKRLQREFQPFHKTSRGQSREKRLARAIDKPESSGVGELGSLLLVDDVLTTGGTLAGLVAKARNLGFGEVRCLVLAEQARD